MARLGICGLLLLVFVTGSSGASIQREVLAKHDVINTLWDFVQTPDLVDDDDVDSPLANPEMVVEASMEPAFGSQDGQRQSASLPLKVRQPNGLRPSYGKPQWLNFPAEEPFTLESNRPVIVNPIQANPYRGPTVGRQELRLSPQPTLGWLSRPNYLPCWSRSDARPGLCIRSNEVCDGRVEAQMNHCNVYQMVCCVPEIPEGMPKATTFPQSRCKIDDVRGYCSGTCEQGKTAGGYCNEFLKCCVRGPVKVARDGGGT